MRGAVATTCGVGPWLWLERCPIRRVSLASAGAFLYGSFCVWTGLGAGPAHGRPSLSRIEQQPSKLWAGGSSPPGRANFNGLAGAGLLVCITSWTADVSIGNRTAFAHAPIDGRAVTEFEPKGKAAGERRELFNQMEKVRWPAPPAGKGGARCRGQGQTIRRRRQSHAPGPAPAAGSRGVAAAQDARQRAGHDIPRSADPGGEFTVRP